MLAKARWPTNPILAIPSTGATARNKCALSSMRSAIKGLGTRSYGSWQTTNFLLLGRKNEPSDSFWLQRRQQRPTRKSPGSEAGARLGFACHGVTP
jgi:hypothetical protein